VPRAERVALRGTRGRAGRRLERELGGRGREEVREARLARAVPQREAERGQHQPREALLEVPAGAAGALSGAA